MLRRRYLQEDETVEEPGGGEEEDEEGWKYSDRQGDLRQYIDQQAVASFFIHVLFSLLVYKITIYL